MKNYDDIIMFTNKYRSEPSLVTMNLIDVEGSNECWALREDGTIVELCYDEYYDLYRNNYWKYFDKGSNPFWEEYGSFSYATLTGSSTYVRKDILDNYEKKRARGRTSYSIMKSIAEDIKEGYVIL